MCERQMDTLGSNASPSSVISCGRVGAENASTSETSSDLDGMKSCLASNTQQSSEQKKVQNRVTFQTEDACAEESSHKCPVRPLLGYDWIAGVLDVQNTLAEYSDDFYNELQAFRTSNKSECIHQPQSDLEFCMDKHSILPMLADTARPEADTQVHECTFSYKLNDRLFPVSLLSPECCPVCKREKSSHPHTMGDPALVRVTIPRFSVLPPYKYKIHRRCSFEPSDSLALPSHCLLGWPNRVQGFLLPPSNLDLRSHLVKNNFTQLQVAEREDQVTKSNRSDQTPALCRLARFHFQHFSPKGNLGRLSSTKS
nr:migration and invasion-inhibitory protein-like isoform X1 [Nerophis lumbriciformis]